MDQEEQGDVSSAAAPETIGSSIHRAQHSVAPEPSHVAASGTPSGRRGGRRQVRLSVPATASSRAQAWVAATTLLLTEPGASSPAEAPAAQASWSASGKGVSASVPAASHCGARCEPPGRSPPSRARTTSGQRRATYRAKSVPSARAWTMKPPYTTANTQLARKGSASPPLAPSRPARSWAG